MTRGARGSTATGRSARSCASAPPKSPGRDPAAPGRRPRRRADHAPRGPGEGQLPRAARLDRPIQVIIGMNQVGEKGWELAEQFDLGDLIGIDGAPGLHPHRRADHLRRAPYLPRQEPAARRPRSARPDRSRSSGSGSATSTCSATPSAGKRSSAGRRSCSVPQDPGGARVRRGREAHAARHRRRRRGPAVHHASQRAGHRPLPPDRAWSCTSSGCWSAASSGSSRSAASIATKASAPGTTPSSRCWRSIRPTATTAR